LLFRLPTFLLLFPPPTFPPPTLLRLARFIRSRNIAICCNSNRSRSSRNIAACCCCIIGIGSRRRRFSWKEIRKELRNKWERFTAAAAVTVTVTAIVCLTCAVQGPDQRHPRRVVEHRAEPPANAGVPEPFVAARTCSHVNRFRRRRQRGANLASAALSSRRRSRRHDRSDPKPSSYIGEGGRCWRGDIAILLLACATPSLRFRVVRTLHKRIKSPRVRGFILHSTLQIFEHRFKIRCFRFDGDHA
jgi:hypothetical protein